MRQHHSHPLSLPCSQRRRLSCRVRKLPPRPRYLSQGVEDSDSQVPRRASPNSSRRNNNKGNSRCMAAHPLRPHIITQCSEVRRLIKFNKLAMVNTPVAACGRTPPWHPCSRRPIAEVARTGSRDSTIGHTVRQPIHVRQLETSYNATMMSIPLSSFVMMDYFRLLHVLARP